MLNFDADSISIIFEFLMFRDAIKLCYSNKLYYSNFLIFCYRFSFVPFDLEHKDFYNCIKYKIHKNVPVYVISSDIMHVRDKIKYADCIRNITKWEPVLGYSKKIKYISLSSKFNTPWDKNLLPDTVEAIYFHEKCKFNYNISAINLPPNLKKISFGYAFNKPIDNLPDTVEILVFCKNSRFNQFINKFPKKLREVYFGDNYIKPLLHIPPCVKIIHFSNNSKFDDTIAYSQQLEEIYFGKAFSKDISPIFDTCIRIIRFHTSSMFNSKFNGNSNSLEVVIFGKKFNQTIDLSESHALKSIKFHNKSKFNRALDKLPPNLKVLNLGREFNNILQIPNSLTSLKFPNNSKYHPVPPLLSMVVPNIDSAKPMDSL